MGLLWVESDNGDYIEVALLRANEFRRLDIPKALRMSVATDDPENPRRLAVTIDVQSETSTTLLDLTEQQMTTLASFETHASQCETDSCGEVYVQGEALFHHDRLYLLHGSVLVEVDPNQLLEKSRVRIPILGNTR